MEGLVVAVPLKPYGYARCVITRHSRAAVTVGYFFGPRLGALPERPDELVPEEVLLVARFGDIPIVQDEWPVLGGLPGWSRDVWPSSRFVRTDPDGRTFVVQYDDKDPNMPIDERPASSEEAEFLPSDSVDGYVIVQNQVSRLLDAAESGFGR